MAKTVINLTKIRKAAQQCIFDPKKNGPMNVLCDMDDPNYWEQRAIELLKELRNYPGEHIEKLQTTISLLLISLAHRNGQDT